ncbi:MAG: alpha/beta hydrolase fold domain-containing protein [Gammaproteobacteria bacterium]
MNTLVQLRQIQQDLVRRLFEDVWNQKRLQIFDDLFAADARLHFDGEVTVGRANLRRLIAVCQKGFPDIRHEIDDVLHSGTKVTVRWHGQGTHLGMFRGMFPTKATVHYFGISTFRIVEGKIAQIWLSINLQKVFDSLKSFSDKTYTEEDFCEDFDGPAAKIYQWVMRARPIPSCKQKLVNAMREQFSTAPVDNRPKFVIPPPLFDEVSVQEKLLPANIRVRIYMPQNETRPLPMLIYFHGGGWSVGSPELYDVVTRKLAYVVGCVIISVDYRLAPEYPYPCGLDDCVAAYKWAREYGHTVSGADTEKIVVAGDSAGGNLAVAVALRTRDEGYRIAEACILICPLTDFLFEKYPSAQRLGYNGLLYDFPFLAFVRASYAEYKQWQLPYVSPMYAELKNFCPTFVLSAGRDPLIDENKAFVKRLRKAGNDVEHVIHEEMPHCYHYFLGFTEEEDEAYRKISAYLRTTLG